MESGLKADASPAYKLKTHRRLGEGKKGHPGHIDQAANYYDDVVLTVLYQSIFREKYMITARITKRPILPKSSA